MKFIVSMFSNACHDFVTFLEDLGDLVHFSLYKEWNFTFLLGDIIKIP